jgi:hypothetical protein
LLPPPFSASDNYYAHNYAKYDDEGNDNNGNRDRYCCSGGDALVDFGFRVVEIIVELWILLVISDLDLNQMKGTAHTEVDIFAAKTRQCKFCTVTFNSRESWSFYHFVRSYLTANHHGGGASRSFQESWLHVNVGDDRQFWQG